MQLNIIKSLTIQICLALTLLGAPSCKQRTNNSTLTANAEELKSQAHALSVRYMEIIYQLFFAAEPEFYTDMDIYDLRNFFDRSELHSLYAISADRIFDIHPQLATELLTRYEQSYKHYQTTVTSAEALASLGLPSAADYSPSRSFQEFLKSKMNETSMSYEEARTKARSALAAVYSNFEAKIRDPLYHTELEGALATKTERILTFETGRMKNVGSSSNLENSFQQWKALELQKWRKLTIKAYTDYLKIAHGLNGLATVRFKHVSSLNLSMSEREHFSQSIAQYKTSEWAYWYDIPLNGLEAFIETFATNARDAVLSSQHYANKDNSDQDYIFGLNVEDLSTLFSIQIKNGAVNNLTFMGGALRFKDELDLTTATTQALKLYDFLRTAPKIFLTLDIKNFREFSSRTGVAIGMPEGGFAFSSLYIDRENYRIHVLSYPQSHFTDPGYFLGTLTEATTPDIFQTFKLRMEAAKSKGKKNFDQAMRAKIDAERKKVSERWYRRVGTDEFKVFQSDLALRNLGAFRNLLPSFFSDSTKSRDPSAVPLNFTGRDQTIEASQDSTATIALYHRKFHLRALSYLDFFGATDRFVELPKPRESFAGLIPHSIKHLKAEAEVYYAWDPRNQNLIPIALMPDTAITGLEIKQGNDILQFAKDYLLFEDPVRKQYFAKLDRSVGASYLSIKVQMSSNSQAKTLPAGLTEKIMNIDPERLTLLIQELRLIGATRAAERLEILACNSERLSLADIFSSLQGSGEYYTTAFDKTDAKPPPEALLKNFSDHVSKLGGIICQCAIANDMGVPVTKILFPEGEISAEVITGFIAGRNTGANEFHAELALMYQAQGKYERFATVDLTPSSSSTRFLIQNYLRGLIRKSQGVLSDASSVPSPDNSNQQQESAPTKQKLPDTKNPKPIGTPVSQTAPADVVANAIVDEANAITKKLNEIEKDKNLRAQALSSQDHPLRFSAGLLSFYRRSLTTSEPLSLPPVLESKGILDRVEGTLSFPDRMALFKDAIAKIRKLIENAKQKGVLYSANQARESYLLIAAEQNLTMIEASMKKLSSYDSSLLTSVSANLALYVKACERLAISL